MLSKQLRVFCHVRLQVLYQGEALVDVLVHLHCQHYLEFKLVEGRCGTWGGGRAACKHADRMAWHPRLWCGANVCIRRHWAVSVGCLFQAHGPLGWALQPCTSLLTHISRPYCRHKCERTRTQKKAGVVTYARVHTHTHMHDMYVRTRTENRACTHVRMNTYPTYTHVHPTLLSVPALALPSYLFADGALRRVPASKAEVFKDKRSGPGGAGRLQAHGSARCISCVQPGPAAAAAALHTDGCRCRCACATAISLCVCG